jgi:O-antigen/teichoic acid export membrane protein
MQLLADKHQDDEAGAFLAGLVIARVPLFLFQAVQASLLPKLSELAEQGRTAELRSGLSRLVLLVSGIGAVGIVGAGVAGSTVVKVMFGNDFVLGTRTMVMLAVGSAAFMVASLLAQASIALGGHRPMAMAWGVGLTGLLIAVGTSSHDLFLRVEVGMVVGGLVALAAQAAVLGRLLRSGAEIRAGDLIEALHEMPIEP